jgi:hypothetical protein
VQILSALGGVSNRQAHQFNFVFNSPFVRYAAMQYDSGSNVLGVWTNNSVPIRSSAPLRVTAHKVRVQGSQANQFFYGGSWYLWKNM